MKVLIILVLIIISMGCINQTEVKAVDTHNEEGDHFLGTAACIDTEVIHYDIVCYVTREDDDSRTTGKIYIYKDKDSGLETTTYDIYQNVEGWSAHFSGGAPMMKCSIGVGEFSQDTYVECPAYSVTCVDDEIVIFANEVEGFELI